MTLKDALVLELEIFQEGLREQQLANLEIRAGLIERALGKTDLANKHFAAAQQIDPNLTLEAVKWEALK